MSVQRETVYTGYEPLELPPGARDDAASFVSAHRDEIGEDDPVPAEGANPDKDAFERDMDSAMQVFMAAVAKYWREGVEDEPLQCTLVEGDDVFVLRMNFRRFDAKRISCSFCFDPEE